MTYTLSDVTLERVSKLGKNKKRVESLITMAIGFHFLILKNFSFHINTYTRAHRDIAGDNDKKNDKNNNIGYLVNDVNSCIGSFHFLTFFIIRFNKVLLRFQDFKVKEPVSVTSFLNQTFISP